MHFWQKNRTYNSVNKIFILLHKKVQCKSFTFFKIIRANLKESFDHLVKKDLYVFITPNLPNIFLISHQSFSPLPTCCTYQRGWLLNVHESEEPNNRKTRYPQIWHSN